MERFIGVDISKGYADFCIVDDGGQVRYEFTLDDTRRGHERLTELLYELTSRLSDENVLVGVEATGGLELNWVSMLQNLAADLPITIYQINPYVLRKFVEQQLHVGKTDRSSAKSTAEFLRFGKGDGLVPVNDRGPHTGLRTLTRKTRRMIEQSAQLKNELHALLQRAHPELVQHIRGHVSQWVLKLIKAYPTPDRLLDVSVDELAEIPYVTEEKARRLIDAARTSVASATDDETALALSLIADDLLRLNERIARLKGQLWNKIKDRQPPHILTSIGGIGRWSATVLYCEIGTITRFESVGALVAYAGLDPRREQSGDTRIEKGISKQGNKEIRSILYSCVTAAIRASSNPAVRALYDRLKAKGKHQKVAEVACMRKLLAIVYGCWTNREYFDPSFERRLKARRSPCTKPQTVDGILLDRAIQREYISAPVSSREAKKRRGKIVPPQKSASSSIRGQNAFP